MPIPVLSLRASQTPCTPEALIWLTFWSFLSLSTTMMSISEALAMTWQALGELLHRMPREMPLEAEFRGCRPCEWGLWGTVWFLGTFIPPWKVGFRVTPFKASTNVPRELRDGSVLGY